MAMLTGYIVLTNGYGILLINFASTIQFVSVSAQSLHKRTITHVTPCFIGEDLAQPRLAALLVTLAMYYAPFVNLSFIIYYLFITGNVTSA